MTAITIRGIAKRFEDHQAVAPLDLTISSGSLFTLLGPSGCGKTTLLRMIAGLEQQDQGSILFGEQDISLLPAEHRRIGMVFQHYALFPHMNVFKNVAYGLHGHGLSTTEVHDKVMRALGLLGLTNKAERATPDLSGGEQQRVALARAIVIEPAVLLFDEPLSNLDARLRIDTRQAIRRLVHDLNITSIFVTHDQEEALSIADEMAIMRNGHVLQQGTPQQCYQQPQNSFVGNFLGRANIIPLDDDVRRAVPGVSENDVSILVRPEHLHICDANESILNGALRLVEFQGIVHRLHLQNDNYRLEVTVSTDEELPEIGQHVYVRAAQQHIRFFDKEQT